MLKGIWNGLTNCEVCIYDLYCGIACCCKRQDDHSESQMTADDTPQNTTNKYSHFESFLTDRDIIQAPDPTSSVSIIQVPEVPRFAEHLEDDNDQLDDT